MKSLLILDIDETLIHTEERLLYQKTASKKNYDFETEFDGVLFSTVKRPFLKEFIDYAFSNFNIAIWTAATRDYAESILKNIGINEDDLIFFYCEENCTIRRDMESMKTYGVKNLNKLRKKGIDLERVLIVDDIAETAINNYGNLIHIKGFYDDLNDVELLKLISYLEKIKHESSYRKIDKRGWSS